MSLRWKNWYLSETAGFWATSRKTSEYSRDSVSPKKATASLVFSILDLRSLHETSLEGGPTFLRIQLTISFSVLPPLYSVFCPFL